MAISCTGCKFRHFATCVVFSNALRSMAAGLGIRATLVFRFRHDCDVIKELDLVR